MNGEINVVALVRGEEQYIFMFDETNRTETLRMLGRCAADPGLSFTWFDAAVLSQKVREMMPAKSTMPAPVSNMLSKQEVPSQAGTSAKISKAAPRFRLP